MSGPQDKALLIKKPGFGDSGRGFSVKTNYFPIEKFPQVSLIHWQVSVTVKERKGAYEECKNLALAHKAVAAWAKLPGAPLSNTFYAFDGKHILYTPKPLPKDAYDGEIDVPDDSERAIDGKRSLRIDIQRVAELDMAKLVGALKGASLQVPPEVIQALNIILCHTPSQGYYTLPARRSFYAINDPSTISPLSGAVDLHVGFRMSVRPSLGKLWLNLDVANTLMYQPGPIMPILEQVAGRINPSQPLPAQSVRMIAKFLVGLKVTGVMKRTSDGSVVKRAWRVFSLSPDPVTKTTFTLDDGSKITVADYFKKVYGVTLKYPHLPCINAVKSRTDPRYIPLEIVRVEEKQLYRKTLDMNQSRKMIDITCQPPYVRSKNILSAYDRFQSPADLLSAFQMQVSRQMANVPARLLDTPILKYGPGSREQIVTPKDGAWNLRDKRLYACPTTLDRWAVIAFGDQNRTFPPPMVQNFVRAMVDTCNKTGLKISNATPQLFWEPNASRDPSTMGPAIERAYKSAPGMQLLLCLLPTPNNIAVYNAVKFACDVQFGVLSQCVLEKHVGKANAQYCANVCMKLNLKLGGVNQQLNKGLTWVAQKPTMVIGADVTHPAPGETTMPSIAAVVGSVNAFCSIFRGSLRIQEARTEKVDFLVDQVYELLQTFYKKNKMPPARIIFFRDGVSEGEFDTTAPLEINAVYQAATKCSASYKPAVTYVSCQKRHHTRFFPDAAAPVSTGRGGSAAGRGGRGGGSGGRGGYGGANGGSGGAISYPYDNIPPGTVVDQTITSPTLFDFYLCSHAGLKGTSRPVHYQVLHDDNKLTQNDLQKLAYELCYLYGKATRSVSIVTPVYYAHIVAKRARAWFSALRGDTGMSTSSNGSGDFMGKTPKLHQALNDSMWFM
ncbi:Piwi domain-containing protein [Gaertneriomyces semiglobifer]|nr:Piwi domain-containing protein [Gaertneriomyces semiglobifer]